MALPFGCLWKFSVYDRRSPRIYPSSPFSEAKLPVSYPCRGMSFHRPDFRPANILFIPWLSGFRPLDQIHSRCPEQSNISIRFFRKVIITWVALACLVIFANASANHIESIRIRKFDPMPQPWDQKQSSPRYSNKNHSPTGANFEANFHRSSVPV